MTTRSVIGVMLAFGLVLVLSASALAGPGDTVEGVAEDAYLDFYIDLMPPSETEDAGNPGSWLDTDGNNINGFVLQSASGIFDGPEDPTLDGWFQTDTDTMISDGMGFALDGVRYFGDIIRPEILPALGGPEAWTIDQFLADLTVTYTLVGQPGTFWGDVIVSQPPTYNAPELMDPMPVLESTWWGSPTVSVQITATDIDPDDVLTFTLDPGVPELVNPWPQRATITEDGQFSWLVEGVEPGQSYDAGVVVTDSLGGLTDTGVLTINIIAEPSTIAMLLSRSLLGLALAWRRSF